ncbi:MAG: fibronectin type III domain-containing protein [Bacteroidota bacterium]
MKDKKLLLIICFIGFIALQTTISYAQAPQIDPGDYPGLVGLWTFDSTDAVKATVGNDLVLTGTHQIVEGPNAEDHATHIGPGNFYTCTHDLSANGGGTKVNKYSLMFDFKIPATGPWYCFYQANPVRTADDGEIFINASGAIGRNTNGPGYSSFQVVANEWYRLIVSVDLQNKLKIYLDGNLILEGPSLAVDADFALSPADAENLVYLLADNNGEDNLMDVAMIGLFDHEIDDATAKALDGYGHVEPGTEVGMHPYLQTPSPTGIFVSWHGAVSGASTVEYGTTSDLGQSESGSIEDIEGRYWHTVQLTGLSPDTEYFYKCVDDTTETEVFNFRTPAEGMPESGHLRYLLLGDTRKNGTMVTELAEVMKTKAQELFGDDIHNHIDLVMHVGDILTNGNNIDEYVPEYFTPYSGLSANIPFMVSIGNHEYESPHYYKYMKYENLNSITEQYYAFNLSGIQFLMVNSNHSINSTTQKNWLEGQLEQSNSATAVDMTFAFWHHPEHSEVWPDGNTPVVTNYIDLLKQYPKVQMLSYGHSHNYERGVIESVAENSNGDFYVMLTGGGGSGLDRWGAYPNQTDYPEIMISLDHYMFNIVDIDLHAKTTDVYTYSLGHNDKRLDVELVDHFHRRLEQAAPETPQPLSPQTEAPLQPMLEASDFAGDDELMTSHFQLTETPGDYSNPLFESKRDWVNMYGDSGAPDYTPVDKNEGIDLTSCQVTTDLSVGATYGWRVRYRDRNLKWSPWSDEQTFTVDETISVNEIVSQNSGLTRIYPNPSMGNMTIDFVIKKASEVTISIINVEGKVIRQLERAYYVEDQYSIHWDGLDSYGSVVAPGDLFVIFRAGNIREVQSVCLL